MPYSHFDRLTALDTTFLDLESDGVHMHVGTVATFEPGPLATPEGGIDFEQILTLAEVGLRRAPRFRQKLGATPITGHPVWIDDDRFNLNYHVRHTALPLPGDERRLKRLAGRIMSQKLDRSKPMWELWFVEGLEGGRFAVISKVHHCLIDGLSGVELLAAFMGPDPSYRPVETHHTWRPRPRPSSLELLGGELRHRIGLPARMLADASGSLEHPAERIDSAVKTATGFVEGLGKAISPASETPLNVPIGPYRRFDWTRFDMDVVEEVKAKLGGTINDVVLACVSGAVRRFLQQQGTSTRNIDFRVLVPVSTRTEQERGTLGNKVSMLVTSLPVDEHDPKRRVDRVIAETRKLKKSRQAEGTHVLEEVSDWTSTSLLTGMSRLAASQRSYNMVVTNVPGPGFPVFLNGARMLESYPLVPLFENQALGTALLSYDGALHWGFNADWEAMPDLHTFVADIEEEFEGLRKL
ncbi:MAG: wax ester/triacylglycerol synthase family O-acyltransferase [Deltaproteobacteria bacterium]|nr:wax ester/triacylglycerol synthase family O-acyltransferase [Deltaproteobacteria bacterium]MBW2396972.1 wax ester/triacylglycerol synthase family O-acyltransferase [Deltaproteobacteria bacterium]